MKPLYAEYIPKFFGLLRTHEIFPETNETSIKVREEYSNIFKMLLEEEMTNEIILEVYGNHFLLNNKLIKPESSNVILYTRLLLRMKKLDLLRIKISSDLGMEELMEFLNLYKKAISDPKEIEYLKKKDFKSIKFWGKEKIENYEEKTYQASVLNFLDILSKVLVFHSHTYKQLIQKNPIDFLNVRRIFQEFISSVNEIEDKSLGFLPLGLNEKEEFVHSVLRAIIATRFGVYLKIPLPLIEDFVFLSLFGTVGLEMVPREILDKKEILKEEKSLIENIGFYTYEILLNMRILTPSTALILNSSVLLSSKKIQENPFFEVFKIIRNYESLIQNKPYRFCYHPQKAMEILWKERDKTLRKDYLESFFSFLSKEPIGSTFLDEKENILVVFSKGEYKKLKDGKWEISDSKPSKAIPLHKLKYNPIGAFI